MGQTPKPMVRAAPSPAGVRTGSPSEREVVRPLALQRSDSALLEGLCAGESWARAALFDQYAPTVARMLRRMLGPGSENDLPDLVQEVFVRALSSLERLRDAVALPAWMHTITARTAFRAIRTRRLRRWLRFWEPSELPDIETDGLTPEVAEAYQRTYALLERMPAAERLVFVLRHVEKLELVELASACEVSLATVKRRLARAQQRFAHAAARDDVLRHWLEEGSRWES
jgi:RNA polymerase sigma-70 factor, ECF subfamily